MDIFGVTLNEPSAYDVGQVYGLIWKAEDGQTRVDLQVERVGLGVVALTVGLVRVSHDGKAGLRIAVAFSLNLLDLQFDWIKAYVGVIVGLQEHFVDVGVAVGTTESCLSPRVERVDRGDL